MRSVGSAVPFRDIIGHRKLVTLLSRSIARGSLPPSLILTGPPGVGKRLAATATAQAGGRRTDTFEAGPMIGVSAVRHVQPEHVDTRQNELIDDGLRRRSGPQGRHDLGSASLEKLCCRESHGFQRAQSSAR